MTERELLVDCLRRLNGATITYYLTGSMASNYWGIPRTTHDLDFVIQLPPSSVDKIVSAFSPDYVLDEHAVRAAYLHKWAAQLGVSAELDALLGGRIRPKHT